MQLRELIESDSQEIILSQILNRIHTDGPVSLEDFESLSYIKKYHSGIFSKYESNLMHLIGLFYKTLPPTSLIEEVYDLYANAIAQETGHLFTPVQASAYKKILNNKYFSFSAPTSSGKSFLLRELIQNENGDIIIVVPSRALIAEYIHAVIPLVDKSVLVLQFIENINIAKTKRRIYIITPERGGDLFKIIDQLNIQLILFDEAQLSEEKIRGMKFDAFVRRVDRLIPSAKKVFAHPFVQNPEAQLTKHKFNTNACAQRYSQNAVGKIYLSVRNGKFQHFTPFGTNAGKEKIELQQDVVENILGHGGTLLVYMSKTKIYDGSYIADFAKYINLCPKISQRNALRIIDELRTFIGASARLGEKHSTMIDWMSRGIVIHHGSMPLRARLLVEQFVNNNYAHICFATSTLAQGINMPFDVVWISNFRFQGSEDKKNLDLKNLFGRAGRSTNTKDAFDYGYVVIEQKNIPTFCSRIHDSTSLKETSSLDESIADIDDDLKDIAEAIKEDSFDNELQLTKSQVERLARATIDDDIEYVLNTFLKDDIPITGKDYYKLTDRSRTKIKDAFKNIYVSHLRKTSLNIGEKSILSVSIPLLLWKIQGKSFKEIVSLRHAFLTSKDEQRKILSKLKKSEISPDRAKKDIEAITIRATPVAYSLPDSSLNFAPLFRKNTSITNFDYDILVYDTYDYLDKVISLSLSDPLTAAFQIYYDKIKDERALVMKNYIKYGTNDVTEIWLLRYGFGFEEIEWIKPHVRAVDANKIDFAASISELKDRQRELIERFI